MRVLNDYICAECGTQEEHFVENSTNTLTCHRCEGTATKVRSVPNFQLPGNDPGYPTAYDRWAKKRDQKIAQEIKADNS